MILIALFLLFIVYVNIINKVKIEINIIFIVAIIMLIISLTCNKKEKFYSQIKNTGCNNQHIIQKEDVNSGLNWTL